MSDQADDRPDAGEVLFLLELESERLRRSRRFYALVLAGYIALVFLYLGDRVVGALSQPNSRPIGAIFQSDPTPAWSQPYPDILPGTAEPTQVAGSAAEYGGIYGPEQRPLLNRMFDGFPWSVVFCVLTLSAGTLTMTLKLLRAQKTAAGRLAELDEIRAVGPLSEALKIDDKRVRRLVEDRLTALLPSLRANQADLLDSVQRSCLHAALYRKNRTLIVAILKAFEQVGDERDLPAVTGLSNGKGPGWVDSEVWQAARTCREFIESRQLSSQYRNRLLRPSCQSTRQDGLLVRPAETAGTDEAALLRPADSV